MKTEIASPTRVDLAGGTLDLWPLYNFVGGAKTVNLAIDIRTRAQIESATDGIHLHSDDLNWSKSYTDRAALLTDVTPEAQLYRLAVEAYPEAKSFRLRTKSESPVGGGLGGSSSLLISMLRAFETLTGAKPQDATDLVHRAHNLEARLLRTPTGTQDYYPAVTGGLSIISYGVDGIQQEVLPVDGDLRDRFLLVYTGRSHHSGLNNFEVLKGAVGKDPVVLGALADLKEIAEETAVICRKKEWSGLAPLFRREFQARIKLAPAFTCPEIEQLDHLARDAGAEAVKICGAGGGGCVMVWCPPTERERISSVCRNAGFQVLSALPVAPLAR